MFFDDLDFFNFNGKTFKHVTYCNNCLKFYAEIDPVLVGANQSSPLFTINLPAEEFLDQAKTNFVENFTWSDELYQGSENPQLDGKPVLVLAVKTNADSSIKYSFVDLNLLADVTDVKNADGTSIVSGGIARLPKATVSQFGVSKPDGNTITVDANGVLHGGITIHALPDSIAGQSFDSVSSLITATNNAVSAGTMVISNTYYGGIFTSSMIPKENNTYFSGNIEIQVSIVENTSGNAVYLYEMASVTDSPYLWTCYAVNDGRNTGWVMRPTWNDLKTHVDKKTDSYSGAHNLRYYEGKLQYNDNGTWVTLSIADMMI